jgi:hypothetical protein
VTDELKPKAALGLLLAAAGPVRTLVFGTGPDASRTAAAAIVTAPTREQLLLGEKRRIWLSTSVQSTTETVPGRSDKSRNRPVVNRTVRELRPGSDGTAKV